MLTSSSPALPSTPVPPRISKLANAFADSLNSQQVSNFLTWMLYHEVVDLPENPDVWYSLADSVHMPGWVALGNFLTKCSTALDTSYGFDLVVLESICDRLRLQRSTVHGFLIHFADPEKMAFSQIATLVNAANGSDQTELELLDTIQTKLQEFYRLATHIKPTEGSIYDGWHAMVMKRLQGFTNLVIGPRIASFRSGAPLVTASTSVQLPKEVKDGIKLNYLYEVMQQKRLVPWSRYDSHQAELPTIGLTTPPSSSPEVQNHTAPDLIDTELARKHAVDLMVENRELRAQVVALQLDKEKLQDSKDKLARKVATLRCIQPATYVHSPARNNRSSSVGLDSSSELTKTESSNYLELPNAYSRPRSLSHDTSEKLAADLKEKLHVSNHRRQRSEVLSWKYEDVFDALDSPPSSHIRLSDPATGELLHPSPTNEHQRRSRIVTYGLGAGRRSGIIFSPGEKDLLNAIRGSTPSPPVEDSDDGDGAVTPTPVVRHAE
jgi:hypothetical protein